MSHCGIVIEENHEIDNNLNRTYNLGNPTNTKTVHFEGSHLT